MIVNKLFDLPWAYRYLRGLGHGGVRRAPIAEALALETGDRILDVGSGTGEYSTIIKSAEHFYLGIDMSDEYVQTATRHYGRPFREFRVGDVRSMDLPPQSFSKALYLGVMHHLNDEDNLKVLHGIKRLITGRLVVMDLSPGGWHVVNNFLCRHDRGRYPRTLERQCELLGEVFRVVSARNYYVRTGVQRYSLIAAEG